MSAKVGGTALWMQEMESFMIALIIGQKIPEAKSQEIEILLSAMNTNVWMGHFEIAPDEQVPAFRHNFPLRGSTGPSLDQLEDMVMAAIVECDRLYPALQFVLQGEKGPHEALEAAMLDTHGEA